MRIRYTLHAPERMKQRGISRELVEECLRHPDKVDPLNDVYRCIKKLDEEVLVLIYREYGNTTLVTTAFISSKTRKYLT